MSKHTPGPWRVGEYKYKGIEISRDYSYPVRIAIVESWAADPKAAQQEAQANARLIAAAPELLEALRDIRDNYDCDEWAHKYGTPCRCCIAAEAIAKVEGKE